MISFIAFRRSFLFRFTAIAGAFFFVTGCCAIVYGPTQKVKLSSDPPGAKVQVLSLTCENVYHEDLTPTTAELLRDRAYHVVFRKPGFEDAWRALRNTTEPQWMYPGLWLFYKISIAMDKDLLPDFPDFPVDIPLAFLGSLAAFSLLPLLPVMIIDRPFAFGLWPSSLHVTLNPIGGAGGETNVDMSVRTEAWHVAEATAAILTFDARSGVSVDEAALLTDRFAVELERAKVYRLISRSKMKEVLELQKYSATCTSVECAVEAGQLLGVKYMVYGSIGRIGSLFTINVYLTDVEKGAVVGSATVDYQGAVEGLLTDGMHEAVRRMLNSGYADDRDDTKR